MLISILNWLRRALAVAVLASLFLPFVTVKGCASNDPRITYTGWEAIWLAPLLVSIPLYAAVAAALTFIGRNHPPTPVGRLILALFKLVWAGVAGMWTGAFFGTIPNSVNKWAEDGLWVVLGASAGIIACDAAEAVRRWLDWRRWRMAHPIPIIDDKGLQVIGWGAVIAGGAVFLAVPVAPSALAAFSTFRGEGTGDVALALGAGWIMFLSSWGLACLTGWGLRRGLLWSLVLQRVATAISLAMAAVVFWLAATLLANAISSGPPPVPSKWEEWTAYAVAITYMTIMVLWAGWGILTAGLLIGKRRRLFPARRVRIETADGPRRALVARCPACGARMWLRPDASELVCRPCGIALRAQMDAGRIGPVKEANLAGKMDRG